MAKKKSRKKNTDTVILIRIPDANARQGEATLTIQRGDLGHIHSFEHTGLSLKSDIAEAVQDALHKLAKIEAAPPPELPAAAVTEPDTDSGDSTDADDTSLTDEIDSDENDAESSPNSPPASESVSAATDSSNPAEDAESVSTESDDSLPESPDSGENDEDSPENPGVSTPTDGYDTDDSLGENPAENTEYPPEELSVSVLTTSTDTSEEATSENLQISLL